MNALINNSIDSETSKIIFYPPLLPQKSHGCCSCSKSCQQTLEKTGIIVLGIFSAIAFLYTTYDSIRTLKEEPLTSSKSIISLAQLGFVGLSGMTLIAFTIFYCKRQKKFQRIINENSYRRHYQGSLDISDRYEEQQNVSGKNRSLLSSCLDQLEQKGWLDDWMKIKGYSSRNEALSGEIQNMKGGLCKGYSLWLLKQVQGNCLVSSQELIDNIDLEQVIYFQFMHRVHTVFLNAGKTTTAKLAFSFALGIHPIRAESFKVSVPVYQCEIFRGGFKEIQTAFFQYYPHIVNPIFAGTLSLASNKEKTSHCLFFQLSHDHYRFHDSGSDYKGFFEFPNQEKFWEGLSDHIKMVWNKYNDNEGYSEVSMYWFSEKENQELS